MKVGNEHKLYPDVKLIFGFANGCHWCDKFKKDTMPMIKGMGLRHQIITNEQHLLAYGAAEYGFPLIVVCDTKGNPLHTHGGYVLLSELLKMVNGVYDKHFPDLERNRSVPIESI
jgi:thioredoxin-related protein